VSGCRRLAAIAISATAALAAFAPAASAAPALNGIFKVPGVQTNNKDVAGPDGNIWVTLTGNEAEPNVARIVPASGEVKEFKLGIEGTTGITVGPDGKLWVTAKEEIASFSAGDPEGTVLKTANTAVKAEASAIVTGPEGKLWLATEGKVLRFPAMMPVIAEEKAVAGLSAHDIDSTPAGFVAISDGLAARIVTLTPAFVEKDLPYPEPGASQGLAISPTGQIAFSDPQGVPEQIGLINPPDTALMSNHPGEDPFGVAYGADGAFWIPQFNDGDVVRLSTTGQESLVGGMPKMSPRQITTGPDNTLWVTLVKENEEGVARISGVEPPPVVPPPVVPPPTVTPAPQTKISKGPKHKITATGKRTKVSFRFSSTTAGAKFQCALTKSVKGKKAKLPSFAGCTSPKVLKLSLGSYRFQVRAVNGSVADATPAAFNFRIVAAKPPRPHRHHR
jgi:streptogramin lyase